MITVYAAIASGSVLEVGQMERMLSDNWKLRKTY